MAAYEDEVKALAAQGDPQAHYALALLYEYGTVSIARSSTKSVQLFQKAARHGIAGACLYLGIKYEHGNGVPRDLKKAASCYQCAAVQGWPMAQYFLAGFYENGKGVGQSYLTAYAWYGLARDQGYPKANEDYLRIEKQLGMRDIASLTSLQATLLNQSQQPCD